MSVSFNDIPADQRVPLVAIEIDNTGAVQGTPALAWKVLFIGQRAASGTIPAGQAVRVTKASQAEEFFGRGSMLASMFRHGKAANAYLETWAIALDDAAAGQAASMVMTVTAAATGAGTLYLLIAGEQVLVGIADGDGVLVIAVCNTDQDLLTSNQ